MQIHSNPLTVKTDFSITSSGNRLREGDTRLLSAPPKEGNTYTHTDDYYIKPMRPSGGPGRGHCLALQNRAAACHTPYTVYEYLDWSRVGVGRWGLGGGEAVDGVLVRSGHGGQEG